MKLKNVILFMLGCLLLTGCNNKTPNNIDTEVAESKIDKESLDISDYTKFEKSIKLLDLVYRDSNTMVSPLSLDMALAIVANGAEGNTLLELEDYLRSDINLYNEFSKNYMLSLDDGLSIANSVWIDDEYSLKSEYKKILEDCFSGTAQTLDFKDLDSIVTINNWIEEKTNGNMKNVIKILPDDAVNVIVNTVHFDKKWEEAFSEDKIRTDKFHGIKNEVETEFLTEESKFAYYENDYAKAFEKYYEGGRYSFVGILPNKEGEFDVSDLDLDNLLKNNSYENVYVEIPEFEFEFETIMIPALKTLGVNTPFSSNAGFPGILEDNSFIKIDTIFQKTKIDFSKDGTKASAVTGIIMDNTAIMPEEKETKNLIFNRPFAFIIMDNETETPLFVGKLVDL